MPPIGAHYGGSGEKVAASMKKQYGSRWKEVFYATEAAKKKHRVKKAMKKAKGGAK